MRKTNLEGRAIAPSQLKEMDRAIGHQLRQYRQLRGLSQGVLGRAIGVSFQQIQKYENGTNRITAARLFLLSRALGLDSQDLLAGLPKDPRGIVGPAPLEPLPKASELETIRILRRLPAPVPALIRRLARSIVEHQADLAAAGGAGPDGRPDRR